MARIEDPLPAGTPVRDPVRDIRDPIRDLIRDPVRDPIRDCDLCPPTRDFRSPRA